MSPSDTTAMTRRRRGEDGGESNVEHEELPLSALEDGRVQEDRIIGQELATVTAAAVATAGLTQLPAAAPSMVDEAEERAGERSLVVSERPRPEDIPVPASPFPTPGASTVMRRLEQGRGLAEVRTPMSYPQGQPRSLFPLFTEEQLTSIEKSQRGAAHLYGQKSLTEPRPVQKQTHEEIMRTYAQKRDEEQEVLWKMLQEARMEADVLRHRNEFLTAEVRNYEKLVSDLQFRTPQGSEKGPGQVTETSVKEPLVENGATAAENKIPEKESEQLGASTTEDQTQMTMQVMLSLMQSMQEMQESGFWTPRQSPRKKVEKRSNGCEEEQPLYPTYRSGQRTRDHHDDPIVA